MSKLNHIIDKALDEEQLNPGEIEYLLSLEDRGDQERLFAAACKVRSKYFGDKIFAYGFVYFSTFCQNDCKFCFYRNSNPKSPRYRKDPEEVLAIAEALSESGVHLIDLTMGEDPLYYRNHDFSDLLEIVSAVKENTELPVMASFGLWPEEKLTDLRHAGADWYACYQETHTPDLYRELRVNQDFNSRLNFKSKARQAGFLIEDGILLGVGESIKDRVRSVKMMSDLEVDQGRVMSFVPQSGTPLSEKGGPPEYLELLVIAVLRLLLRDSLVPASLDVAGIGGLKDRLKAGANVVTSIIPPSTGLKGVSNSELDIEEGKRTVAGVKEVLEDNDLRLANVSEYKEWIKKRREG